MRYVNKEQRKWLELSSPFCMTQFCQVGRFCVMLSSKNICLSQELRDLDPNGFRALIDPIKSTDSAVCTSIDLAKEYFFNTILTALLCLLSMVTELQVDSHIFCHA